MEKIFVQNARNVFLCALKIWTKILRWFKGMEKMSGAILYNLEFAKKNCERCILNVSIVSGQKKSFEANYNIRYSS